MTLAPAAVRPPLAAVPASQEGLPLLAGTHLRILDRKGRLTVPLEFRHALGTVFMLTRAPEGMLMALPLPAWHRLARRHRGDQAFRLFALSGAMQCRPTPPEHRLRVPLALRQHAGLAPGADVALVGMEHLVLLCPWEPWRQRLASAEAAWVAALRAAAGGLP